MKSDDVRPAQLISIHALRVEGDGVPDLFLPAARGFLSTPSGWRATAGRGTADFVGSISIHALRVEGDW